MGVIKYTYFFKHFALCTMNFHEHINERTHKFYSSIETIRCCYEHFGPLWDFSKTIETSVFVNVKRYTYKSSV